MPPEKSLLQQFLAWKKAHHVVGPLIVLLVFGSITTARHLGWLQFLEFQAYDFFVRRQPVSTAIDPVVLVELVEADIQSPSLDYPLHDSKLAELLRILMADGPTVLGVDIWRDIPVPKDRAGLDDLNQVLLAHTNLIAIFTLAGIAPPPVLRDLPNRIAFNDSFPVDFEVDHTIPKVRRVLLYAQSTWGETYDSLPYSLALHYLEHLGIRPEPDPDHPEGLRLGKALFLPLTANDGAYVNADSRGFQTLLDFKCSRQFTRFSVGDALAGKIPPGSLRNKIVILGINTPSVSDERVTPISREHRGIEVQALATHQFIRRALDGQPPLRTLNDWAEDSWTLLWCIAGSLIGYFVRSPWKFTPSTAAALLSIPAIAWAAFAAGWWIPLLPPAVGFAWTTALAASFASSRERVMRSVLMQLYSRHVSKEIAEAVWASRDSFLDGQRPLAQKLTVTVLFTDLKGFSTIAEKMEPARLYEWLNSYLGSMAQVIQQNGGVLKQFTGDGILALFGVPIPHHTRDLQAADATAAVRAAMAMGHRLVQLIDEWQKAGLPPVSMRAGICTGEVAAGSVGSDERFEYAVVGDVVNTAARLESYDKSIGDPDQLPMRCRILIGGPTHDLLDDQFVTTEIGLLQVKGKANRVAVFQVLGERPPGTPKSPRGTSPTDDTEYDL